MYLHALSTAVPGNGYTQAECWEIVRQSPARQRLSRRSMLMLQGILRGDSGVQRRHFAVPQIEKVFDYTADELNAAYRQAAPALAADALARALRRDITSADAIDALFVCSCTGYLCPGVTSYVAERMGLRADAFLFDVVGHGCGAALPMIQAAHNYLTANPGALVATVAVEICSAAFYLDDDPGVLISACIFADGAAAALWRGTPPITGGMRVHNFESLHRPGLRDRLRFEQRDGKLRNLLHSSVPDLAADGVRQLLAREVEHEQPIDRMVIHPGGRDVIEAIENALGGTSLPGSRAVLANYGNMSSPSVLFVLEHELNKHPPAAGNDWWLTSFGAGFSLHSCRLSAVPIVASPSLPAAISQPSPALLARMSER